MLALYDLLRLLGYAIQLNVSGARLVVKDFELQALADVLDMLEHSVGFEDRLHGGDLFFTALGNLLVLGVHDFLVHQNCVLVVSGHG